MSFFHDLHARWSPHLCGAFCNKQYQGKQNYNDNDEVAQLQ